MPLALRTKNGDTVKSMIIGNTVAMPVHKDKTTYDDDADGHNRSGPEHVAQQ